MIEQQGRFPKGTYKVLACRQGNTDLFGVVNLYTGNQARCRNLWEMVKVVETDLCSSKYPQCCVQYRAWNQGGARKNTGFTNVVDLPDSLTAPETGSTFIVKVLFQQNATWQGTIQWLEGRQTRQFRSVNELMWLMDEAMDLPPAQPDEPTG